MVIFANKLTINPYFLFMVTKMKQSFCFKNFSVIPIGLIIGIITIGSNNIFSVNSALAEPNCFMIDSNGNMMNLSSLCGSSKSNSGSPTSRITSPLPSEQNSPDNNNLDQSSEQKSDPNNPDNPNNPNDPNSPTAKGDSNSNEANQADNNSEKKEVDRSELPPVQRAIPLINKQRNPEATEKP